MLRPKSQPQSHFLDRSCRVVLSETTLLVSLNRVDELTPDMAKKKVEGTSGNTNASAATAAATATSATASAKKSPPQAKRVAVKTPKVKKPVADEEVRDKIASSYLMRKCDVKGTEWKPLSRQAGQSGGAKCTTPAPTSSPKTTDPTEQTSQTTGSKKNEHTEKESVGPESKCPEKASTSAPDKPQTKVKQKQTPSENKIQADKKTEKETKPAEKPVKEAKPMDKPEKKKPKVNSAKKSSEDATKKSKTTTAVVEKNKSDAAKAKKDLDPNRPKRKYVRKIPLSERKKPVRKATTSAASTAASSNSGKKSDEKNESEASESSESEHVAENKKKQSSRAKIANRKKTPPPTAKKCPKKVTFHSSESGTDDTKSSPISRGVKRTPRKRGAANADRNAAKSVKQTRAVKRKSYLEVSSPDDGSSTSTSEESSDFEPPPPKKKTPPKGKAKGSPGKRKIAEPSLIIARGKRMASLNATAMVQCLYENESRDSRGRHVDYDTSSSELEAIIGALSPVKQPPKRTEREKTASAPASAPAPAQSNGTEVKVKDEPVKLIVDEKKEGAKVEIKIVETAVVEGIATENKEKIEIKVQKEAGLAPEKVEIKDEEAPPLSKRLDAAKRAPGVYWEHGSSTTDQDCLGKSNVPDMPAVDLSRKTFAPAVSGPARRIGPGAPKVMRNGTRPKKFGPIHSQINMHETIDKVLVHQEILKMERDKTRAMIQSSPRAMKRPTYALTSAKCSDDSAEETRRQLMEKPTPPVRLRRRKKHAAVTAAADPQNMVIHTRTDTSTTETPAATSSPSTSARMSSPSTYGRRWDGWDADYEDSESDRGRSHKKPKQSLCNRNVRTKTVQPEASQQFDPSQPSTSAAARQHSQRVEYDLLPSQPSTSYQPPTPIPRARTEPVAVGNHSGFDGVRTQSVTYTPLGALRSMKPPSPKGRCRTPSSSSPEPEPPLPHQQRPSHAKPPPIPSSNVYQQQPPPQPPPIPHPDNFSPGYFQPAGPMISHQQLTAQTTSTHVSSRNAPPTPPPSNLTRMENSASSSDAVATSVATEEPPPATVLHHQQRHPPATSAPALYQSYYPSPPSTGHSHYMTPPHHQSPYAYHHHAPRLHPTATYHQYSSTSAVVSACPAPPQSSGLVIATPPSHNVPPIQSPHHQPPPAIPHHQPPIPHHQPPPVYYGYGGGPPTHMPGAAYHHHTTAHSLIIAEACPSCSPHQPCSKNVLTGPLTGLIPSNAGPVATSLNLSPVLICMPQDHHPLPSPARGSVGMPQILSPPAISCAKSWSPPKVALANKAGLLKVAKSKTRIGNEVRNPSGFKGKNVASGRKKIAGEAKARKVGTSKSTENATNTAKSTRVAKSSAGKNTTKSNEAQSKAKLTQTSKSSTEKPLKDKILKKKIVKPQPVKKKLTAQNAKKQPKKDKPTQNESNRAKNIIAELGTKTKNKAVKPRIKNSRPKKKDASAKCKLKKLSNKSLEKRNLLKIRLAKPRARLDQKKKRVVNPGTKTETLKPIREKPEPLKKLEENQNETKGRENSAEFKKDGVLVELRAGQTRTKKRLAEPESKNTIAKKKATESSRDETHSEKKLDENQNVPKSRESCSDLKKEDVEVCAKTKGAGKRSHENLVDRYYALEINNLFKRPTFADIGQPNLTREHKRFLLKKGFLQNERGRKKKRKVCMVPRKPLPLLLNGMPSRPPIVVNGWKFEGKPVERTVFIDSEGTLAVQRCYDSIRHVCGDKLFTRSDILLHPDKPNEMPYVARISALWENYETGEMMISLFWYYRSENTPVKSSQGPHYPPWKCELYASNHRDVNSVACIDDKCFVLAYDSYCRYFKERAALKCGIERQECVVPPVTNNPFRSHLPPLNISTDLIFFCEKTYEPRLHRISKYPFDVDTCFPSATGHCN